MNNGYGRVMRNLRAEVNMGLTAGWTGSYGLG